MGSGTEYRRLAALVGAKARLIVPLAFPDAPKVATLAEAESVSLRELMSWEQAPTNARRLAGAGLSARAHDASFQEARGLCWESSQSDSALACPRTTHSRC